MNAILVSAIEEVRRRPVEFSGARHSGARENMLAVVIPPGTTVAVAELARFLEVVVACRTEQVVSSGATGSVTFYAWHDEIAGQLRYSVARCGPHDLPFGAPVRLLDGPSSIASAYLDSPHRTGMIPGSELRDLDLSDPATWEDDPDRKTPAVLVWAKQLQ